MMMVLFFGCVGLQIAGLLPEFTLFGFSSGPSLWRLYVRPSFFSSFYS